jgi:hypothetical protein
MSSISDVVIKLVEIDDEEGIEESLSLLSQKSQSRLVSSIILEQVSEKSFTPKPCSQFLNTINLLSILE